MYPIMENVNWLSLIALLLIALMVGPRALRMNRGPGMLQKVAVWLAILVGLMFVYETFGPF
jgi:hypothetical protein